MSYIGNTSTQQSYSPTVDYFSGNGSTTAFTLSRPAASVADVQVTIDNVAQNPSSAYTVSGSTITFTSAPLSGTNNIYVRYTSLVTQSIAPGQGTVNTASLGTITTINSGASNLSLQTNGTTSLTVDTSGNILNGVTAIGSANPGMYVQNNQATSTGYNAINTNASGSSVFFAGSAFTGGTYCGWQWNGSSVASGSYVYNNPNVAALYAGGNNNLQIGCSGSGSIKFYNATTQSATINSSGYMTIPNQPHVRYGRTAGNVAGTAVAYYFNAALDAGGGFYNTGTGRFTCPVAGNYLVTFQTLGIGSGTNWFGVKKNGSGSYFNTGYNEITASPIAYLNISSSTVITCAVNDYLEFYVLLGTFYGGDSSQCNMSITLVS